MSVDSVQLAEKSTLGQKGLLITFFVSIPLLLLHRSQFVFCITPQAGDNVILMMH